MPPNLPEPMKVSPIIKIFRYAFLAAGVFYGLSKHTAFKIREGYVREEREKRKAERDAQIEAEKQAASDRDIEEIVRIFTPPPKPQQAVEVHQVPSGSGVDGEPAKVCKLKQKPPEDSGNVSYEHDSSPPIILDTLEKTKDIDDKEFKVQDDMFSDPINFKGADEFKDTSDQPMDINEAEGNGDPLTSGQGKNDLDGYFVQSFPDGIPLIDREPKGTYDFPKGKAD